MQAKKKKTKDKKKESPEEIRRQLQLIHTLAKRLPWITMIITLIAMIFILLELFFKSG
ncbi:MAG: hypothetical protein WB791_05185 [Waddliaceae bacterium]